MLELSSNFPLQVSSSPSPNSHITGSSYTNHTPPTAGLDACKQQLLLNWTSLFTYQEDTTVSAHYSDVSFNYYSLVFLASKLCSMNRDRRRELPRVTQCWSLNSTEIITRTQYRLFFESSKEMQSFLNHPPSRSSHASDHTPSPSSHASFSSDHTPSPPPSPTSRWMLWLELEMELVNGTSLVVTSEKAVLEELDSCSAHSAGTKDELPIN